MSDLESSTENLLKFRRALRETFTSEAGKRVLEFLEQSYVDIPVMTDNSNMTYYRLGQKEFVQGLIKDANQNLDELEKMVKGDINVG